ncbi:Zn-dependent hydrolase [Candidatus Tachikawaea gelatinosa]|uniref:N-carbamoyl-L-amino acid hydrolase n=1 Tax=Candidatus Tachikawaea gelatinosa TaxID=1410383 RepID=A0A090AIV0_9ENTR|nr:Zn-dependent hydrolase [Candidatus Tachikawaea gelatinosa]BAP58343.1 N-carbamoyl-L-amino acid hydrolase [Candidatus Tachikawaea gelatinosa]
MNKILITFDEAKKMAKSVMKRCNILGKISENKNIITRLYLSKEHKHVNIIVEKWMQKAGMKTWQDEVGNICGRYEGNTLNSSAILMASHLDTVKNAGKYDGILGVLSSIEIVHWFHKKNLRFNFAIEVIGFADEEGVRFGIPFLGSKGIIGEWIKDWLNIIDNKGISLKRAMEGFGLNPNFFNKASRAKDDFITYLELHIEQGPYLYLEKLPLAVVKGINGMYHLECKFIGESGHAGTVPMSCRKDVFFAFSEWLMFLRKNIQKEKYSKKIVSTIGKFNCFPNVTNVIPESIVFSLDLRSIDNIILDNFLEEILNYAKKISYFYKTTFIYKKKYHSFSVFFDEKLQEILLKTIKYFQKRTIEIYSGAGHDAISFAKRCPTGMIFIRCKKGISHNPNESVLDTDVALSLQVFIKFIININQNFL